MPTAISLRVVRVVSRLTRRRLVVGLTNRPLLLGRL
jgi:hypothetical protein